MTSGTEQTKRSNTGFTLVELLVVISIVSLLVAMLLPALGKARETAQTILCGSQMRQQAIAVFSYATESKNLLPSYALGGRYHLELNLAHNGFFPSAAIKTFPTFKKKTGWHTPMLECPAGLMGPRIAWDSSGYPQRIVNYRNGASGAAYTNYGRGPRRYNDTISNEDQRIFSNYNWNGRYRGHYGRGESGSVQFPFISWIDKNSMTPPQRRTEDVTHPADTWMAGDGQSADLGLSSITFRHQLGANLSYLDGHVETLTPGDIDGGNVAGSTRVNDLRRDMSR